MPKKAMPPRRVVKDMNRPAQDVHTHAHAVRNVLRSAYCKTARRRIAGLSDQGALGLKKGAEGVLLSGVGVSRFKR